MPRRVVGRASDKAGTDFSIVWDENDNGTWTIPNNEVLIVLLCEIREELKRLNALLGCRNFTRIPRVLDAIAAQTKKRKYVRKETS